MKYVVRMRKTIIQEYDFEVPGPNEPDEIVDNVIDAMDLAEDVMREGLLLKLESFKVKESEWSPIKVVTKKENENV